MNKEVMFKEVANANPRLANGKIHQSDRNAIKVQIMDELKNVLSKFDGFEMGFVNEGLAINVQNEEVGNIVFVIDAKMKNLDFDFDAEVEDFEIMKAEKEAKAIEQAKAKAEKIKADAERRQKIAELKAQKMAENEKNN